MKKFLFTLFAAVALTVSLNAQTQEKEKETKATTKEQHDCSKHEAGKECTKGAEKTDKDCCKKETDKKETDKKGTDKKVSDKKGEKRPLKEGEQRVKKDTKEVKGSETEKKE